MKKASFFAKNGQPRQTRLCGKDAVLELAFGDQKKSTNDLSSFQFAGDDATTPESSITFDPNGSLSNSMIRRLAAPQSTMRRWSQSKIAAISMDRLQFSRLGFVGRNQEVLKISGKSVFW
jgi:hypothetical protein